MKTAAKIITIFAASVFAGCASNPTSLNEAPKKLQTQNATSKPSAKPKVHNAYAELPEIEFVRTKVSMDDVAEYIRQTDYTPPIKISCYAIFMNESAGGTMGINNNYIGYQADGHRVHEKWTKYFVGTVLLEERMTGSERRFLAFSKWEDNIDILLMRVKERGLYVGGYASHYAEMDINTDEDWPVAYYREWVMGNGDAVVPEDELHSYLRAYKKAKKLFE
jgi:hypothetical protein